MGLMGCAGAIKGSRALEHEDDISGNGGRGFGLALVLGVVIATQTTDSICASRKKTISLEGLECF